MKITAKKLSLNGSKTVYLITLRSSAISEHSSVKGTPEVIREWLMSLQADSPASPTVPPESGREAKTTETCGLSCLNVFASLDPNGCWLKMFQGYSQTMLDGSSEEFCETWPVAGILSNGNAYRQPNLERRIRETDSGLWLTPSTVVIDGGPDRVEKRTAYRKSIGRQYVPGGLAEQVKWATPTQCGNHNRKGASDTSGDGLATQVKQWPTPRAGNPGSRPNQKGGKILAEEVKVSDNNSSGQLNPDWVSFYLMGWHCGWTKLEPLISEEMKRYGKKMQLLRKEDGEKKIQPTTGRQCYFHKEEILQSELHGKRDDAQNSDQISDQQKTDTFKKREMPKMRNTESIRDSSYRQQLHEQQYIKPNDIMCILSHEMALGEWEETAERTLGLQNLWDSCERLGVLSKALPTLQEVWQSLDDEEKKIIILCAIHGTEWIIDPADCGVIPRVTNIKKDRVSRLKAIGNGQVPACVVAAWKILTGDSE